MLKHRPLNVAVLCSSRAPGVAHLLTRAPHRGSGWNIVCCVTSEPTFDPEVQVERRGVPVIHHSVREFYSTRFPEVPLTDLGVREAYDEVTVRKLRPFAPDVVLLAGYLLVLTEPMLAAFPGRIFNVHHSDLLLRGGDGMPKYPGLRAVRDAILAGEHETRATAHIVTPRLDEGPPVLRSWSFPVPGVASWAIQTGARDVLKSAIWAHQEWVLRSAFGPLLAGTLDLVVDHELDGQVRELDGTGSKRSLAVYA